MKLSSLFAFFVTCSIITVPALAQDAVRPNPQVEAKAAQALLDAEIKLQKGIPLNMQGRRDYKFYSQNFNDIAVAFARLGRTQSALKALQFMPPHSASKTTSEVLRLSVRRSAILGDVKRAASLIPQIKNNNARADALLTVARAYLRQNDYAAAQEVLFQVTPLVPRNFYGLLYTASLFAQSGDIDVAKRLFDRAKGMLQINDESKIDEKESRQRFDNNLGKINAFSISVVDAGLIDEWQELRKSTLKFSRSTDARVLDALLHRNEIDLAIEAVRQSSPVEKIAGLCIIAYYIAPEYPDRASSLLQEAGDALPLDTAKLGERFGKVKLPELQQGLDMFLTFGYKKLGKEEETQRWFQQWKHDTPENKQALTQLQYYIKFLSISDNLNEKSTFPPEQLLHIHEKIQPYLSQLHNNKEASSLLWELINAQITAGQIAQATGNIMFLEKDARQQMLSATDRIGFSEALTVAGLWKKSGNQKLLDALLQTIFDAPQKIQYFSKIERIKTFVTFGFVDEGLRLFHSLPVEGKKPPQSIISELPYALAVAHPNEFPYELLKAKQPYTEASNISRFADGLTNALFQTRSEQKFVLRTNGRGAGLSAS